MTADQVHVTATVRLAATLEVAPVSVTRWAISKLRTFRAIEGDGFEGTLTFDGKVAGEVLQEGNGGGTWFQPANADARRAMEALLREWADVNPELSMPTSTITINDDGTRSASEAVPMVRDEHVLDVLVENHRSAKRLTAAAKRGKTPVLTREQAAAADDGGEWNVEYGIKEYGTVNAPLSERLVAWAVERDLLIWTEGRWVEAKAL